MLSDKTFLLLLPYTIPYILRICVGIIISQKSGQIRQGFIYLNDIFQDPYLHNKMQSI